MKTKKIPMRSCVVTREKLPKRELIRVVIFEGNVSVDETGKKNGKGYYIKKDRAVLEKARKTRILDKLLGMEVPDNIYDEISSLID